MHKKQKIIVLSFIISITLISFTFFSFYKGYIFRVLFGGWEGDNPYDEFYCYVYNIYPKCGKGMGNNLPPDYLGCYVDTNAPPDHIYAKFYWYDDAGYHRSTRIWFSYWNNIDGEVIQIDDDTYYVKYFISNYTSSSKFIQHTKYEWQVNIFYCENPTTGAGSAMWWMSDNSFFFYTDYRPPIGDYPLANAGGPYNVNVGRYIRLDGSQSITVGEFTEFIWDIYNDGTWDVTGEKPLVKFTETGTFQIKLRVVNTYALYDDDVTTVTVTTVNHAPVADAGGPYSGNVGETITLDGSGSYDPDGDPLSYEWDVDGDGTWDLTGETVSVIYYEAGTYNVVLKVSDGQYTDTDTTTATITQAPPPPPTNEPPVADAGGPYSGNVGETITLDGSGSYDPDGYIVEYKWDVDNDGVWDLFGEIVNITFNDVGLFVVRLCVVDDDGAISYDIALVSISKEEEPPSPPPTPPQEKSDYTFLILVFIFILLLIMIILWKKGDIK